MREETKEAELAYAWWIKDIGEKERAAILVAKDGTSILGFHYWRLGSSECWILWPTRMSNQHTAFKKITKQLIMKAWILKNKMFGIGAVIGLAAGYLYWKYVGCLTGTCAITSNPFRSSLYFAVIGALIFGQFKGSRKTN